MSYFCTMTPAQKAQELIERMPCRTRREQMDCAYELVNEFLELLETHHHLEGYHATPWIINEWNEIKRAFDGYYKTLAKRGEEIPLQAQPNYIPWYRDN